MSRYKKWIILLAALALFLVIATMLKMELSSEERSFLTQLLRNIF